MFKNEKGISRIALILIVMLVIGAVATATVLLMNGNSKNNGEGINILHNSDSKWKIKFQGEDWQLPFNLKKLTDKGFEYTGDNWENTKFEKYTQGFATKDEDGFFEQLPSAGIPTYGSSLELMLVQKENTSREYKNITVAGFSASDLSTDFLSINGVGCGTSVDEFTKALDIDLNSDNVSKSDDLYKTYGSYFNYIDKENNMAINVSLRDGVVWHFEIFINDRDYLK